MKSITWITATFFIDVDHFIVPYLAKYFKIHWIIFGGPQRPATYDELVRLAEQTGFEIEYRVISGKWYLPAQFFKFRDLFNYAKSLNNDLIYIDCGLTFWNYYAAISSLPTKRTIVATHNVKTPKGARLEKFARYFMKHTLQHFVNFQVFSKNQGEYLRKLVQDEKNVLYAPLALKDYGPKGNRNKYHDIVHFLSFGHIRRYKRIDLLIDAAQILYEETHAKFKVTIAGNCTEWDEYAKKIKYPELFDLQIGFIEDCDVAQFFADADYLVLPYQDLAQSGAITVAFNYDVPVITSNIEQFKEFVDNGQNGFMFESESAASLKDVMRKALLMQHGSDYQGLVNSTHDYVSHNYALSSIADKYISYFNKLQL